MTEGSNADLARRRFLAVAGLGAAGLLGGRNAAAAAGAAVDPWAQVGQIVARIGRPRFPARDFPITRYGAVGNGFFDCTAAFRAAIAACNAAGGGRVVVPAGTFLTGAVRLLSNVNLFLAAGATLRFKPDPSAYLPAVLTRWEGNDCYNYAPLVRAYRQRNVAITGSGTLDGQASPTRWWPWAGKPEFGWRPGLPRQGADQLRLRRQGEGGVPVADRVYGAGHYLRPALIEPYGCEDVLIEGVTVRNAPMWSIHPFLCRRVTVRGVTVVSQGPNNDGCDPECCQDVLIEGCTFDTWDDCVALKAGRGRDGFARGVATTGVVVRDCRMRRGGAAFAIGSEASGGVGDVFVENLVLDDPRLKVGILIKSNADRGGTVRNIHLRGVRSAGVQGTAVFVTYYYNTSSSVGPYRPMFDGINLSDAVFRRSESAVNCRGWPDNPIRRVTLTDCAFDDVARPGLNVQNVQPFTRIRVTVNGRTV